MVVHRAAFEAVGGFDEGFFMYFEDVDLCDRLGRQGWTSVYVPQAKVLHVGGHSTTKDPASADLMARTHHRSAYRYLSGRYAGPARAPLRWAIGAGLTVRYGLSRVVAAVAEDPVLLGAFEAGEDIHRRTASEVFNVPMDQVTSEQRSASKAVNFGLLYLSLIHI